MLNNQKLKKVIKNPWIVSIYLGKLGLLNWIPSKLYLSMSYRAKMKKKLNLKNPQTFNEKIQWLKLYDRQFKYSEFVDKYKVREYISEKLGEEYLIPLIGVYDNFDEINFCELPDRFVLKCTHDSGGVVICKDKKNFDIENARNKINRSLRKNYYYYSREWPYKNVIPRIICEKYMDSQFGDQIKDYKFMCFNGKVRCSFVCSNRGSEKGLNVDFYDLDWNHMPFERHYKNSGFIEPRPKNYKEMIKISEKLSKNIPFVRVDFYEVDGKVYFGELTFYPGAGFEEFTPEEYDYLLGSWIQLPNNIEK